MSVPSPSHYLFADAIFLLIFSGGDPDMHLHDVSIYKHTDDSSSLLMSHGSQITTLSSNCGHHPHHFVTKYVYPVNKIFLGSFSNDMILKFYLSPCFFRCSLMRWASNVLHVPPHQLRGKEDICPLFGRMSLGFQSLWTSKFAMEFVFFKKYKELKTLNGHWGVRHHKRRRGRPPMDANADCRHHLRI